MLQILFVLRGGGVIVRIIVSSSSTSSLVCRGYPEGAAAPTAATGARYRPSSEPPAASLKWEYQHPFSFP